MKRFLPLLGVLSFIMGAAHAESLSTASTTAAPAATNAPASPLSASIAPAPVLRVMERVADWQLAHPSHWPATDWTQAAGYTGILALAGISGDPKYRDAMQAMGERNHWQLTARPYNADDHCVGQAYADLYLQRRDPVMIAPMRASFDFLLAHPSPATTLEFTSPHASDLWSWCDSLYMAPPAWMSLYQVTGDKRWMNYAVTNWWRTYDYLYDKEEHLFFRDSTYFGKKEANGKKIYWGRGNGWVMGALVHMLQRLPAGTPEDDAVRSKFEKLFREMAPKILSCQQPDGLWRASLLDPASYPLQETSGSSFYTYALTWGVNQGLLDRATYEQPIRKAWNALVGCVDPDGKLTHVQPVGADPKNFTSDATEVYGVGAFLLAGSEVYRMALLGTTHPQVVKVSNPSSLWRESQTVSLDLPGDHAVMEGNSARILDSQSYESEMESGSSKFHLLFQTDLAPGETRSFLIFDRKELPATPQPIVKTSARFIPERLDDFTWESDRIAHRIYGQALMTSKEGTVSSGIDVWIKMPRQLTVDILYKGGHYHDDNGLYLDDYRVGKSRGCGGLGIWDGKQLSVSRNYRNWKLITTGPIRSEFEVTYDPWNAGQGRMVSETKRFRIDAGSWFTEATSTFSSTNTAPLTIGVGLAERTCGPNGTQIIGSDKKEGWMTYWQPEDTPKGTTGTAIILPKAGGSGSVSEFTMDQKEMPEAKLHESVQFPVMEGTPALRSLLAITQVEVGKPFSYLLGACWDRSGDFTNSVQWDAYTAHVAALRDHPIQVSIGK